MPWHGTWNANKPHCRGIVEWNNGMMELPMEYTIEMQWYPHGTGNGFAIPVPVPCMHWHEKLYIHVPGMYRTENELRQHENKKNATLAHRKSVPLVADPLLIINLTTTPGDHDASGELSSPRREDLALAPTPTLCINVVREWMPCLAMPSQKFLSIPWLFYLLSLAPTNCGLCKCIRLRCRCRGCVGTVCRSCHAKHCRLVLVQGTDTRNLSSNNPFFRRTTSQLLSMIHKRQSVVKKQPENRQHITPGRQKVAKLRRSQCGVATESLSARCNWRVKALCCSFFGFVEFVKSARFAGRQYILHSPRWRTTFRKEKSLEMPSRVAAKTFPKWRTL